MSLRTWEMFKGKDGSLGRDVFSRFGRTLDSVFGDIVHNIKQSIYYTEHFESKPHPVDF